MADMVSYRPAWPCDLRPLNAREAAAQADTVLLDRDAVLGLVQERRVAGGHVFDIRSGPVARPGKAPHAFDWLDRLPRPEDYILTRSRETLKDIRTVGEWGGSRSKLIAGWQRQTRVIRVN